MGIRQFYNCLISTMGFSMLVRGDLYIESGPGLHWYFLAVVFAQSIEARCWVENEDVVGAAPTGDAPTTCEWSTILLLAKVAYIRGLTVCNRMIAYQFEKFLELSFSHKLHSCRHVIARSSGAMIHLYCYVWETGLRLSEGKFQWPVIFQCVAVI